MKKIKQYCQKQLNILDNSELDSRVTENFMNVKLWFLIPAFLLLFLIFLYFVLFNDGTNFTEAYVNIQKDLFFFINAKLSVFPNLQFNLTQLGDAMLFYPLLSIFIIYAPKLWEALLISSIFSLIISALLKKIFSVPRPAAMFDNDSFTIIGKTLTGKTSLPSGHSICAVIVITTLLFSFMPKKNIHKIIWSFLLITLGLIIAFSRVGVGAHYPLDVIIGSIIGFVISVIGIQISNRVNLFAWIKNKKNYPIFMLSLIISGSIIIKKIIDLNLFIFYVSLLCLVITLSLMASTYVKKNK
jgi:membrane-associated phospholipid phosphatase